jgi:hypothetical protein
MGETGFSPCTFLAADQDYIDLQEVVSMRIRTCLLSALVVFRLAVPTMRQATAQTLGPDTSQIPVTISLCESPAPNPYKVSNCGSMTWKGQRYEAKLDGVKDEKGNPKSPPTVATITFERDQYRGVTLKMTDIAGTVGGTATYTGKITADNKISGTVTWSLQGAAAPCASGTWSGDVMMPASAAAKTASQPRAI